MCFQPGTLVWRAVWTGVVLGICAALSFTIVFFHQWPHRFYGIMGILVGLALASILYYLALEIANKRIQRIRRDMSLMERRQVYFIGPLGQMQCLN